MTDLQDLKRVIDTLDPVEAKTLYDYIAKHFPAVHDPTQPVQAQPAKPRILGLHAHLGAAWLSEDFFDELPDHFWLGEA